VRRTGKTDRWRGVDWFHIAMDSYGIEGPFSECWFTLWLFNIAMV
jgi:hypothetical protein